MPSDTPKAAELRNKTVEELTVMVRELKADLYDTRSKIATRQIEDNNKSRRLRRQIARILTVLNEKTAAGKSLTEA
ncbi:MAG: 50S ribosomal protein L29 [Candidatus Coatesbacteria bacterium]|nr:MAG: 50S ribosomal protein L29 [Candidatus Coatesbacteria bacterium]